MSIRDVVAFLGGVVGGLLLCTVLFFWFVIPPYKQEIEALKAQLLNHRKNQHVLYLNRKRGPRS